MNQIELLLFRLSYMGKEKIKRNMRNKKTVIAIAKSENLKELVNTEKLKNNEKAKMILKKYLVNLSL